MNSLKNKVLENLGKGLSVNTLCDRLNITYNDLCIVAKNEPEVDINLRKWYKKHDFTPKPLKIEEKPAKPKKKSRGKVEHEV